MSLDSFGCVQEIARFSEQKGLKDMNKGRKTASPAFSYLVTFFEATVAAAKAMKDHLRIEFMGGEINAQLSKISLGVDRRPAEFPRKFTRIWLSNIPQVVSLSHLLSLRNLMQCRTTVITGTDR